MTVWEDYDTWASYENAWIKFVMLCSKRNFEFCQDCLIFDCCIIIFHQVFELDATVTTWLNDRPMVLLWWNHGDSDSHDIIPFHLWFVDGFWVAWYNSFCIVHLLIMVMIFSSLLAYWDQFSHSLSDWTCAVGVLMDLSVFLSTCCQLSPCLWG